jgi:hypothetical protein
MTEEEHMSKNKDIVCSPRKGGNSDLLCDQFMHGVKSRQSCGKDIFTGQRSIIVLDAEPAKVMEARC